MRFILCILALALTACAAQQRPGTGEPLSEAQRAATVAVHMLCASDDGMRSWRGSGVIVDETTVLTAYHVADCDGDAMMAVETLRGVMVMAVLGNFDEGSDVASLILFESIPGHSARIGKPPGISEVICAEAAIPTRARKCGRVRWVAPDPAQNDIRHDLHVVGGNSGSGVYDQRGMLVGIVTLRRTDGPGGAAASLWSHKELLMPLAP